MGPFIVKGATKAKVGVITKDYILHISCMYWSIKYQNYILNIFFGTKYQYWNQTWPIL